ncbi:probable hexosyltransferase MUCI70 [Salvia splendens]|uniref:probable hexosyltransferase MUCI70 n=1 Tax=Salvia splendens TaxID=180675 RepID=UPI001C25C8EA|nr:probable hexosyltransferase MUCI70 [Salvia splendens]XP_042063091.1 probable hexosyltransferase MUCI70 [Salvia splendens]
MTGGSLGLRQSGSCGSLQLQAQNGGFQLQDLYLPRRSSKTCLAGYREKEKFLPATIRYLSRKKVAMLIFSVLTVLAFLTGFFTINKEDDFESFGLPFDARYLKNSYVAPWLLPGKGAFTYNSYSMTHKVFVCNDNTSWGSLYNASVMSDSSSSVTDFTNPCKDFAFPPPPPGDTRRIGPRPCPVCYVPVEQAIGRMPKFPSPSPVLHHITYFSEENSLKTKPNGGSEFGGYPSLKQRNESFEIKESMTVHCGFVKGCRPGYKTAFDIDVADLELLEQFHEVIVASAIFGNYDVIQQPRNIGEIAKRNVPFFMFVDEETETYLKNVSTLGSDKMVGLWRVIVVHNLPYTDSRRNGKVPKLLLHRLLPKTRYSVWIDGKLQLVVDPYQVLERFLWRQNATFAISRHYRRFDVFEEAEANKAGMKYDNTSIDRQIEFYKREGLTPYTTAKLPITSDVPEGCVIIREHIPITNLLSCLWFNEVDRFTSRDQLSFSTVRDKVAAKVNWSVDMFLDCERRNFVIQAYHRDILEQRAHLALSRPRAPKTRPRPLPHPPPTMSHEKGLPIKGVVRRGKDKRPSTRRRRRNPKTIGNFL